MGIYGSSRKPRRQTQTSSNNLLPASNISNIQTNVNNCISYIECTYDIKDINSETQIMNNRGEIFINEEIESKIKILNGNQREKLTLKKKI